MIRRIPWRAALRPALTPILIGLAAVAVGIGAALIVISTHQESVRERVEQARTEAAADATEDVRKQYDAEVSGLREELDAVREARDACYRAADHAAPVIYDYYASEPDAQETYGWWLPQVTECRNLAAPTAEGDGQVGDAWSVAPAIGGER